MSKVLDSSFGERKSGERENCLLVREGLFFFIVLFSVCEDGLTTMSANRRLT